jgi:hypothetical protein
MLHECRCQADNLDGFASGFPRQLLHWPTGDSDNSLLIGTERWDSGDPSARPSRDPRCVPRASSRPVLASLLPMLDFNARGHTQARDRPIFDPSNPMS